MTNATTPAPTAAILVIGDEILSGRTQDTNTAYIAQWLGKIGIRTAEARVVSDSIETIGEALNALRARYTYVFTTGGIGPTHDDITADAVAHAFDLPIGPNAEAVSILTAHYKPGDFNEARQRMARTPEGAILIENPISKAPGFQVGNVFVMAGIPRVMQAMLESLRPRLTGGPPLLSQTISVFAAEGTIADTLTAVQGQFPDVPLGSYPFYRNDRFGTSLVGRSADPARLAAAIDHLKGELRLLGITLQDGEMR